MQKKLIRFTLLCSLFFPVLSFAATQPNTVCSKQDATAIHTAILDYIIKNSAMPSADVMVLKMQCFNHFASAIVHPKQPVTDDAVVYLHQKEKWDVISMGTDFDKHFLKKIPKQIRSPNE